MTIMDQRKCKAHLAPTTCMAKHRQVALFTVSSCVSRNTKGTESSEVQSVIRHRSLLLPVDWPFDISVCILCLCVCLCDFFIKHSSSLLWKQRLPQTITHCDGSLLLHNEMTQKHWLISHLLFSVAPAGGPLIRGGLWSHCEETTLICGKSIQIQI